LEDVKWVKGPLGGDKLSEKAWKKEEKVTEVTGGKPDERFIKKKTI